MTGNLSKSRKQSAVAGWVLPLASFLMAISHSFGCGLDWSLPTNHFEGVNEHGYVSYWEKVGEVDLGDDLKLPININFRSNRETISPYLGKSFLLALLESNIVQTGDNSFMATFPDGSLNLFIRNNPNETVLEGSAGWKGEIRGDVIDAYASCGWKLSFYRGHIQTLSTPKNRKLEFIRSGNVVTEIRENGAARLTVERESAGAVKALLFNGKRMEIALDQKPRVQTIAGQNVVGGIDKSLRSLTPTDGPSKSFEFAGNDKLQPTLKITSKANTERLFTWDPATKRIISDNDWTYQITAGADANANAAINRTNANKQSEFWFRDGAKGQEITQGLDGVKKVTSWFVTGPLSGKIRKIEQIVEGKSGPILAYRADYNEIGRLMRETKLGKQVVYNYDISSRLSSISENGHTIYVKLYDSSGRVYEEDYSSGRKVQHIFSGSPSFDAMRLTERLKNVGQHVTEVKIEYADGVQVNKGYYDKDGNLIATEYKWGHIFEYTQSGEDSEVFLNGRLCNKSVYHGGHKIKETNYSADGDWVAVNTYNYSSVGLLNGRTTYLPSGSIISVTYKYDALGQIVERLPHNF